MRGPVQFDLIHVGSIDVVLISNAHAMLLYDRIADKSGFVQYRKVL